MSGSIGLVLIFFVEALQYMRISMIDGGIMEGVTSFDLLGTHLLVVPIIFLVISVIFLLLWLYKDLKINK
nr:hypothetical protein [Listeria seeligeri]